ncbi:DNA-binding regulatory protein, YebC/PmpR family [Eremococcus coleocola ACS-139-V-Col8]|uniref:Probable transcriptional regulatory protein HMPREF9257_0010 n=2 Tax=Eremococcus TaxID=171412 RepID=E4KN33_9LACT|nr:DNA-binding regulatory protein, YebC/PmpR family [Eremococcus coleocola ACS-139-V-Col8]
MKKMSGHNKWSKIKNKKGAEDARKGAVFGKLSKEIFMAAKNGGGDPSMNSTLRMVLDKAKAENMPKDNITRAIKKATDAGDMTNYDEITYEGYGSGGIAILVHTLTDNKNRTDTGIHVAFSRNGGNLGTSGSVAYMFDRKGYVVLDREELEVDEDTIFELAIEAGAEDVQVSDEAFEIYTDPSDFAAVKEALEAAGYEFARAELTMVPQNTIAIDGEKLEKLEKLVDALEDDDDVQQVYTNADY